MVQFPPGTLKGDQMDQDQEAWDAICGTDEDFANWMCEGQHPEMQKMLRRVICGPKIEIETEGGSGGMADALG